MEMRIVFLGDIVCTQTDLLQNCNFDKWFEKIKTYWGNASLVVTNLETPIAEEVGPLTNAKYRFNSPKELVYAMKDAGINFIATANNHCLDRGIDGLYATISHLDKVGLKYTGTFKRRTDKKFQVIECGTYKIGICAVTYGTNAQENRIYLSPWQKYCVNMQQSQEYTNPIARFWGLGKSNFLRKKYFAFLKRCGSYNAYKPPHERKELDFFQKKQLSKIMEDMKQETDLQIVLLHEGCQFKKNPSQRTIDTIQWFQKRGIHTVITNHEHIVSRIRKEKDFFATYALGDLTGAIGHYEGIMGKRAEFSIAVNMYIDERKNIRYTFSILKRIEDKEKQIYPVMLYDLYLNERNEKKKSKLYWENIRIYNTVTGLNLTRLDVKKEYDI